MKYSTLFFDLDNTLLDFTKAEACAVSQVFKNNGLPYDDATVSLYSEVNSSFWQRFERGEIERNEIFEGRFIKLLSILGIDADASKISEDYKILLSMQYFTMPFAKEILIYLKEKGYKIYITTNGFALTQNNRIKNCGLSQYFDGVFISEQLGYQKPDKKYFFRSMELAKETDKSQILVIGDSLSSDILGGKNAGIDTCWLNTKGKVSKYSPKYEITELSQLKNIL